MYIRTVNNAVLNTDVMSVIDVRPCHVERGHKRLVAVSPTICIDIVSGTDSEIESAMNTLVEGIARGATLVSYYKEDCTNETVDR